MFQNKQLLYNLCQKKHSLILTEKETKTRVFSGQTLLKSVGEHPKSMFLFNKSKLSVKVYSSKLVSELSPLINSYGLSERHSVTISKDNCRSATIAGCPSSLAKKAVKFVPMEYQLENFQRSNQDTCITHKPAVNEGDWVQSGDILTDCASSVGGELSLGQNLLIAYMPWEGYNFEDAILISERLVIDDLYTSVHIERYEMEIHQTNLGTEEITREIPDVTDTEIQNLDSFGVVKIGSWVEEGDILVGKITPIPKNTISPYQKLLYTILEKQVKPFRDSSLRAPKGVKAKVIDIKYFSKAQTGKKGTVSGKGVSSKKTKKMKSSISSPENPRKGVLSGKLTDMMPGGLTNMNSSLQPHPSSLEMQKTSMTTGLKSSVGTTFRSFKLKTNTFIKALNNQYSPLKTRLSPENMLEGVTPKTKTLKKSYYLTRLNKHEEIKTSTTKGLAQKYIKFRNVTFQVNRLKALNEVKRTSTSNKPLLGKNSTGSDVPDALKSVPLGQHTVHELQQIETIHIYLAETRKIQVGDKMSGRHGNKGIVSQILPIQDMPYLPDGTPIDMVLNPLGVPSRMNVGQIYECLLGLAGKFLGENYKVPSFDEIYGPEASRSFVFNKLYEARKSTGFNWLFDPNNPGKMRLYDGRTGSYFDQAVTVGRAYILRLVHMVDDKIHMRSTGPYSLVTQQPLRGRSKEGGQRLGEMEVWALEGYGAAFTLLEMLTIKSDDMTGRMTLWSNLILNKDISIGTPESFKVLICELQALCLDIGLFRNTESLSQSSLNTDGTANNQLTEIDSLINLP